jgi:hypothetical protein
VILRLKVDVNIGIVENYYFDDHSIEQNLP